MPYYVVEDIDTPELTLASLRYSIGDALEHMFEEDLQLLGIESDGDFVGMVTYRSLARALLISDRLNHEDAILELPVDIALRESVPRVSTDDGLSELFDLLGDSPFVLVESESGLRVVRDVDLHQYLHQQIVEFLLIEEIERTIRDILRDEFGDALSSALEETFEEFDQLRTPTDIQECSFRHYTIFISCNWSEVDRRFENQRDFVRELIDRVGDIRNRMFHFRADPERSSIDRDLLQFAREQFTHTYYAGDKEA